jgi:AraC family transcriptional regulator, regulatory protein of adaptative response / DNA-3-methyladenine glycosylase II
VSELDPAVCYRALSTRDARFDGRFFVGVVTTGVYCRPVCPARTARRENVQFYRSAAAAQEAGFRPCLRCRPETAPEHGAWRGTSNTVSRGLGLIARGELDGEEASVERLASLLGVGERQLRRLFEQHLGASPNAVAQTRRVLFAKQLLHETTLSMSDVAFAAGFGSVRRFNETFQRLYGRPPSALRARDVALRSGPAAPVTVRLRYRPPFEWEQVLLYLAERALDGVERVDERRYARTVQEDGEVGTVEVSHLPEAQSLAVTVRCASVRALPRLVLRVRRVFDLEADLGGIGEHLSQDPLFSRLVSRRPGLRVPGGWDGFELGVRAILGQQVSVRAARALAEKLVELAGTRALLGSGLARVFPTPNQLLSADLGKLGMPGARREALQALARATLEDPTLFDPQSSVAETVERLCRVRGVGAWTAEYVALRAAREPDAFPAGDRGLQRGYGLLTGTEPSTVELERLSERWRPWRAYAAAHLWAVDAARTPMKEAADGIRR